MNTPDFILCPKLGFFAVGNSRSFWNGKQTVACCQWVILHGQETTITTNFHNYFIKNKQKSSGYWQDVGGLCVFLCTKTYSPQPHDHLPPPSLSLPLNSLSLSHTHTHARVCTRTLYSSILSHSLTVTHSTAHCHCHFCMCTFWAQHIFISI